MSKINLKDYYSFYTSDYFIEISEKVLEELISFDQLESNYLRRMYYNKAQYSLDCGDGIENELLFCLQSPKDIYQNKLELEPLYDYQKEILTNVYSIFGIYHPVYYGDNGASGLNFDRPSFQQMEGRYTSWTCLSSSGKQ